MGYSTPPRPPGRPRLTWPIILIALGIIFLVGQFVPQWGVSKTWPVILVVIGIMKLLDYGRPPRAPRGPKG